MTATALAIRPTELMLAGPLGSLDHYIQAANAIPVLSAEEERTLLGAPPRSTFFKWKSERAAKLSADTVERISYVMGKKNLNHNGPGSFVMAIDLYDSFFVRLLFEFVLQIVRDGCKLCKMLSETRASL